MRSENHPAGGDSLESSGEIRDAKSMVWGLFFIALGGLFLRTSLALGGRERVAFADELALAERYLAIEQVRFGERLRFRQDVEPAARACQLPPLLIQPLVENAVKHGVADRVDGGTVLIEARRRDGLLVLTVENPCDPEAPARRSSGHGLENVRRRLAALDPRATRVDVFREPECFRVVLTLPAVEAAAEDAAEGSGDRTQEVPGAPGGSDGR